YLPDTKLIVLTMYSDALYVTEALRLGVSGYVLKSSASSELMAALQAAQTGKRYFTPLLVQPALHPDGSETEPATEHPLTDRQIEVLQLVAEGKSVKEIAYALDVSVKTAQFHKANIMERLGLRTTAELVKYAIRRGLTRV